MQRLALSSVSRGTNRFLGRKSSSPPSFSLHRRHAVDGSSSWAFFPALLGLAAIAGSNDDSGYYYCNSGMVTRLQAVTTEECSTFRLFAALDAKEEMEKVRLAQILHDLHSLAQEGKAAVGGLRRHVTMVVKDGATTTSSQSTDDQTHPEIGDNISLAGVDLTKLTPQDAQQLIRGIEVGSRLDVASLGNLIAFSTRLLQKEANLIDVSRRKELVTVVGDLHGSLENLAHILEKIDIKKRIVVFDGDFVDRGDKSLEVLVTLLILKLAYPENVYLIRGNHEDSMVASVYGFQDEIRKKYGDDDTRKVWKLIGRCFAALPLALRTKTALVVHGGIPSPDFNLKELQKLPKEERFKCETIVNPVTKHEKFLAGIVWSDPTEDDETAVTENPRGVGILFGSQIAQDFLKRSGLRYLVRGHEVVHSGVRDMQCGQGKSVITVFSAAAYPANIGTNRGAIVHLHPDGSLVHESYSHGDISISHEKVQKEVTDHALAKVRSIIGYNRSKLEKAFAKVQMAGKVTIEQWARVMSETVESCGMPWVALQPKLAPVGFWTGTIDVDEFLRNHSFRLHDSNLQNKEAEVLAENQEMLLTVFKFLDTNGDGTLSPKEFRTGVKLLNKRLPPARQLSNPDGLFKSLDADGNGEISFEEFTDGFGMK